MRPGLILIFVGVLFLLNSLGLLGGIAWDVVWPIVVVMLGLCMVIRDSKQGKGCSLCGWKCCGHDKCQNGCVGACKNGQCGTCGVAK